MGKWRKVAVVFIVMGLALNYTFLNRGSLYALSDCQRKLIDSNVRYFNCNTTQFTANCAGNTNLTGSDNDEKIWNYLISKGLTAIQAAGIMGNFQAESGFDPTIVQGDPPTHSDTIIVDGETGYGIAQWTSKNRQQALLDFATQGGKPATNSSDLGTQLDFMYMESTTGSLAGSWDTLKEQTSVPDATLSWHNNYESSADTPDKIQNRINFAEENFNKFSSSGGGTTTSSGGSKACATNGSGEVVGGFSLPVDRHFYDEHPDWFSAPHHDYAAVDIPVPTGTNVYSMSTGTVIDGGNGGKCGTGIIVDAGSGVTFMYCHGSDGGSVANAKVGDKVNAGQLIMHSASTGESTGPHLHVQIEVSGSNRCPQPMMEGIAKGTPPQPKDLPSSGCVEVKE